ncbi:alpha-amylase [Rudanella paleaurantiibacter]|uniref:Alpha-amylase n=1 Tax=Rudanella paleaurantiibacter TaxID=2614655 RepID=A0A7J5TU62_9BACT|nr:alpha-amylase family glycosyl hydrolase [Rudanella paleaurantiibacter]KAB7727540.1 alpha-amylase [Rudanella paleaurantiibacter]
MNTTVAKPKLDKLVIYQIFTRLFGNQNTTNHRNGTLAQNGVGKFTDIDERALTDLRAFGATHIWYTGILEHATATDYSAFGIRPDDPSVVKGLAGSPYAVKDYYDVDPDMAVDVPNRMAEFEELLKRTQAHGLKVIIDFVPNHVARQYHSDTKPGGVRDLGEADDTQQAFSTQNNFYYLPGRQFVTPACEPDRQQIREYPAKVTGSGSLTESPSIDDWYETVKLNYGLDVFNGWVGHFDPPPATWHQMLDILLFWAAKGVDGFRCDMAHLIPVQFWQWAIGQVKSRYPHLIFIAEIYDPGLYRRFIFEGGFDYLYDKVGLYDSLRRLMEGHGSCHDITRVWQQESGDFSEHMLRFLETHDEQRIASRFFAGNPWIAVPAMVVTATLHTGPLLLYFGQELGVRAEGSEGFSGDDGRTTIFDYWGIPEWQDYLRSGFDNTALSPDGQRLKAFYGRLNALVNGSDAIQNGAFYDLQWANNQTPGYNGNRLYAYLRHTPQQRLLIVCNFDREQWANTTIHIPGHAWQTMQLDETAPYRFVDVFGADFDAEVVPSSGVPVTLPPLGVLILDIR